MENHLGEIKAECRPYAQECFTVVLFEVTKVSREDLIDYQ